MAPIYPQLIEQATCPTLIDTPCRSFMEPETTPWWNLFPQQSPKAIPADMNPSLTAITNAGSLTAITED
jgi:hypothetical protein